MTSTRYRDQGFTLDDARAAARQLMRDRAAANASTEQADSITSFAEWQRLIVPSYTTARNGDFHDELEAWAWDVCDNPDLPRAGAALWGRGLAKSTKAEITCVMLGARRKRNYCLYVCGTQALADDHVRNIAGILESDAMERVYPAMADRQVGKHGESKGWRRDRVATASGYVIDALGLDTASRGVKLDEHRPDLIIIDDIDREHDSTKVVDKKLRTLTNSVLMAGSTDTVVLFVQNLIHRDSIATRFLRGKTDMLTGAKIWGPVPALYPGPHPDDPNADHVVDVRYIAELDKHKVIQGIPSWPDGFGIEVIEDTIDRVGLTSFMTESQHDVDDDANGLFIPELIRITPSRCPHVIETAIAIDPPASKQGTCGLVSGALVDYSAGEGLEALMAIAQASNEKAAAETTLAATGMLGVEVYADVSCEGGAYVWPDVARREIERISELTGVQASVTVEVNNGGDNVTRIVRDEMPGVMVHSVRAHKGEDKEQRATPVVSAYKRMRVKHLDEFEELEEQMLFWRMASSGYSPDRLDALVWLVTRWLPYLTLSTTQVFTGSDIAARKGQGRLGVGAADPSVQRAPRSSGRSGRLGVAPRNRW